MKKQGYSLIEVLVVLVILGLLIGIGAYKYREYVDAARVTSIKNNCHQLERMEQQRQLKGDSIRGDEIIIFGVQRYITRTGIQEEEVKGVQYSIDSNKVDNIVGEIKDLSSYILGENGVVRYCKGPSAGLDIPPEPPYVGEPPKDGEEVIIGDYVYAYNRQWQFGGWKYIPLDGWGVRVLDDTKTVYGKIESEIKGKPVTYLTSTFADCKNLVTAPEIPSSVTNMHETFAYCDNLLNAPIIPGNVESLYFTFQGCVSLVTMPEINNGVTTMWGTFSGCTQLSIVGVLPSSVTDMSSAFYACTKLTKAPEIPPKVTDLEGTFQGCTNLLLAPRIPTTAINIRMMFRDCIQLTTASEIPASVENFEQTFVNCQALRGEILIHTNTGYASRCFEDAVSTPNKLVIKGSAESGTKMQLMYSQTTGNISVE